eukprot:CAMPEP_0204190732 /NCGR_PEP_ID=MMETSP0361-20130328/59538_1 /ASSEMBLY_ACC=CAM_ASM_000343 /TAXON_ID=268821 /ORGANISM="Scrippsiella Hangoei, Strain SHTV-5" /LENGTH=529 /DNA_ID=CAMNT_0051151589 /DNA_START=64 /DNA_END=1653 /DNA_ORIENTATION=+
MAQVSTDMTLLASGSRVRRNLTEEKIRSGWKLSRTMTAPLKRKAYPELRHNDYVPMSLGHQNFDEVTFNFTEQDAQVFYDDAFGSYWIWFVPCLCRSNSFRVHEVILVGVSFYYLYCVLTHIDQDSDPYRRHYETFFKFGIKRHGKVIRFVWVVLPWFVLVTQRLLRHVLGHSKFLEMLAPTAQASTAMISDRGGDSEGGASTDGSDQEQTEGCWATRVREADAEISCGVQDLGADDDDQAESLYDLYTSIYGPPDKWTNPHPKYWYTPHMMRSLLRSRFCVTLIMPLCCTAMGVVLSHWFPLRYLVLLWLGMPMVYVCWCALQAALLLINFIAVVCFNEIERLRLKMEVQWEGGLDWREIAGMHHYLDQSLTTVTKMVALPLFTGISGTLLVSFVCLIGGLQSVSSDNEIEVDTYLYFLVIFVVSTIMLLAIYPLCQITDLCMSQESDKTSLLLTAAQHGHNKMKPEERMEYNSFMLYLHNTNIGVELPVFGHLNYSFLFSKAATLASTIPIVLTIFLGDAHEKSKSG